MSIQHLPDPEREVGTDPIDAYLQGCEAHVEDTRAAFVASNDHKDYVKHLQALDNLRRARLHAHGVECPNPPCNHGEVIVGWDRGGGLRGPADPVMIHCPVCGRDSDGLVMPETRDLWLRIHPEWDGEE